ncbi:MAG: group II intron reverse transcriptase/maturase [candidate division Zixibacteria bacterium]|nr:group II intron reverse transcriptase/maturase [candidate division Zixibacteria bacterium]
MKMDLFTERMSETRTKVKRAEPVPVKHTTEHPASHGLVIEQDRLMEEMLEDENLQEALKRVIRNGGSPGVDGMTVKELPSYISNNRERIEECLLSGTYEPKPVKRVEIPKPNGGVRKLGIPTVMDRYIQQMVLQVLQAYIDPTFSESSFGFRPNRSAHQAIARAQEHIHAGHRWVVDMDLEKFFDRVNHDILMGLLAKRIKDKRVLKLIRAFLNSGVMDVGLISLATEGTPQGGPLSPLLSNVVLDVLDKELERRGHRFVRYADDCNIYVKSERAGDRVMESITRFLEKKLKLKVNEQKSAVGTPSTRKFLGFSFTSGNHVKRRIASQALKKFKARVRAITKRSRGLKLEYIIFELNRYLRGWYGYFGFCETPSVLVTLNGWIRHRLRSLLWKRWKTPRNRRRELRVRGVSGSHLKTSSSGKGPWRIGATYALSRALPNSFFRTSGLYELGVPKSK